MGFSLKSAAKFAVSPVWGALDYLPHRPDAPNLPPAPTLTAAQLPNYPGFTPEQQALLQQQQGYLTNAGNLVDNYGNNPYLQQSNAANQQALTNYQNALQGKIDPSQAILQQKQKDFEQLKQQAGLRGIQISGDTPESAISQSTSGNQALLDFNKRYDVATQNYNQGQLQLGLQAQQLGLGQQNQTYQNQLGGYGQLSQQAQSLYQPYQQQQLGQFGVNTQQAMMNADVGNQNALNAYQQATGQTLANYNNSLAGYQQNMGLLQSGLGLAGQLGAAYVTGGASAAVPKGAASTSMGMQPRTNTNLYNPGQSWMGIGG